MNTPTEPFHAPIPPARQNGGTTLVIVVVTVFAALVLVAALAAGASRPDAPRPVAAQTFDQPRADKALTVAYVGWVTTHNTDINTIADGITCSDRLDAKCRGQLMVAKVNAQAYLDGLPARAPGVTVRADTDLRNGLRDRIRGYTDAIAAFDADDVAKWQEANRLIGVSNDLVQSATDSLPA